MMRTTLCIRGVLLGSLLLLAGCKSEEEVKTTANLSNYPEIQARGGIVKNVEFVEGDKDETERGVMQFKAEVYNTSGELIGKAYGRRVEGFGSHITRVWWQDSGDPEPENPWGRGRRRGRGRGRR